MNATKTQKPKPVNKKPSLQIFDQAPTWEFGQVPTWDSMADTSDLDQSCKAHQPGKAQLPSIVITSTRGTLLGMVRVCLRFCLTGSESQSYSVRTLVEVP